MKAAILGGDERMHFAARGFRESGFEVFCFAVKDERKKTLEEVVSGANIIVLPLPCKKNGFLNAPFSDEKYKISEVLNKAPCGAVFFAGMADEEVRSKAEESGIELIDYFMREDFTVMNAALTAQGAAAIFLNETQRTVSGQKVMICGFGRLGKLCAKRFEGLGTKVSVSARKSSDVAWIKALGFDAKNTNELQGQLEGFDLIVNTVPAMVFDKTLLTEVSKDCLCIDLAPNPGGFDKETAKNFGIKLIAAPSLPAKAAPQSAGMYIKECICNILKERGE